MALLDETAMCEAADLVRRNLERIEDERNAELAKQSVEDMVENIAGSTCPTHLDIGKRIRVEHHRRKAVALAGR